MYAYIFVLSIYICKAEGQLSPSLIHCVDPFICKMDMPLENWFLVAHLLMKKGLQPFPLFFVWHTRRVSQLPYFWGSIGMRVPRH